MAFNPASLSRVTRVKNPNYRPDGLKSYGRALVKYRITPTVKGPFSVKNKFEQTGKPSLLSKLGLKKVGGKAGVTGHTLVKTDATTGQTGEVTATDIQQDTEYLAPVGIGTPAQTVSLDFDTGSSDLWVFSTELPTADQTSAHTIFNPSKSSTWKLSTGSTWEIEYGDGSTASGNVGTDVLTLGGLTVQNQAIELAEKLSSTFASGSGDGLLGLAWPSINTVKPTAVATPVENMITQQDIPSTAELFTANLGSWRDTSDPDKGVSFYTFGYIDEDVVSASGQSISYAAIDNSQGFWMFDSASASVNGTVMTLTGNTAIADTGTTLALVSDQVCEAIYGAISGAKQDATVQGWVFPSSTTAAELPTVEFAVGDKLFQVQPEDLSFADAGNGYVYGGIQSRGEETFDILGDVFLKSVYAIFDQSNKRLGLVPRIQATQNLAVPTAEA